MSVVCVIILLVRKGKLMEDEYTSYGQLLDLVSRIEECGYAEAEELAGITTV